MTMWTVIAQTALALVAGIMIGVQVRYTWIR